MVSTKMAVLVVDDDRATCRLLQDALGRGAFQVEIAESGKEALAKASSCFFDVVLSDVRMPDLNGLEVLRALRQVNPETLVIMMTAFGSIETAIETIKEGAYDYISKPFKLEDVKLTVKRALDHKRLLKENLRLRQELKVQHRLENIVGRSAPMLEVYKIIARVASSSSTVLVQGESGTGKELIAKAIHYNSPRADHPFVVVDCGALAETLLESELFGHVKGAFTGAIANKKGLLEEADGGTCFLDELGDVGPSVQAKLLRFLQEREIRRVGEREAIKLDVRVIAATNKDLETLVHAGKFREDLFYRVSVVSINIPRLCERREDIPLLAEYFLSKYALQNRKDISHLSPEAVSLLREHGWAGNVRELEHVIEQAVALTSNPVLLPEDLPPKLRGCARGESQTGDVSWTLREGIKRHIRSVLWRAKGNKKLAAQLLEINRRTHYRLAKRHQIDLGTTEE
jgi:two-component system, NtrC family, response regulator AtoC